MCAHMRISAGCFRGVRCATAAAAGCCFGGAPDVTCARTCALVQHCARGSRLHDADIYEQRVPVVLARARAAFALYDPYSCHHLVLAVLVYVRAVLARKCYLHMPAARSELVRAHVACMCSRACSLMPCDTYTCQQLVLAVGSRSRGLRGMTLMYANSCVTLSHASSSVCSRACSLVQHEADTYEQHVRAVLERTCGTRPRSCSPRAV